MIAAGINESVYFLAYKDLNHRKSARELMWQEPDWGDCVANTGKLSAFCLLHLARFSKKPDCDAVNVISLA